MQNRVIGVSTGSTCIIFGILKSENAVALPFDCFLLEAFQKKCVIYISIELFIIKLKH